MTKIKLLSTFIGISTLTIGVTWPITSCGNNIEPTGITIEPIMKTVTVGKSTQLNAIVSPAQASQEVLWTSSDESIASIDRTGKVWGLKPGKCYITAQPKGYDILNTCDIEVEIDPGPVECVNFNECQWHEIVDACTKLENGIWDEQQFSNNFKVKTNKGYKAAESFDDFIGQQRTIDLNGQKHNVIVVGCQQDFQGDNNTNPVGFTFQFDNLVSDNKGEAYQKTWGGSSDFWSSNLDKFLNSENNSVYQMIADGDNDDLYINIKSVYRGVNVYDESLSADPKFKLSRKQTKLFCATLSNMFSSLGINNSTGSIIQDTSKDLYINEGQYIHGEQQYSYYVNEIGDEPCKADYSKSFECLMKCDCNGFFYPSWFGSAWVGYTTGQIKSAWTQLSSGVLTVQDCNNFPLAVLPCFCI